MLVVFLFLFRIIADYTSRAQIVNIEPTSVTALEHDKLTFTCTATVQDDWRSTKFVTSLDTEPIIDIVNNGGNCFISFNRNSTLYDGRCKTSVGEYTFDIRRIDDRFHNQSVQCLVRYGIGGQSDTIIEAKSTITIMIPVTSVTMTPVNNNNRLSVISGEQLPLVCKTNSIRPAACIQWYIAGQNVTNQSSSSTGQDGTDKTRFISSSTLVYTGRDADHGKVVYCEAMNIEERDKTKSPERAIFIILPVATITIKPAGNNDLVSVMVGKNITFTCKTGPGRPAARIQWYIGGQNVTNQTKASTVQDDTDDTKLISTSTLVYTGNDADHNKRIYCEAFNTDKREHIIKTENKTLYIIVPISSLNFEPTDGSDQFRVVKEQQGTFTCRTNLGRPSARIQWYIGKQNVTNQATSGTVQDNTDKFISNSTLVYTGRDADHNKVIFCEAVNTERGEKVKTDGKTLYIIILITDVTFTTDVGQNVVKVNSDEIHTFTCETRPGRPAARIQWYITGQNMTDQSTSATVADNTDNTKLISTSTLVYRGKNSDHDKVIYCEAVNNVEGEKIKTENKTLYIIVPISNVTINQPVVGNAVTVNSGESKNFTCKTDSSRPAAWIQWYIRGRNVTNQAILETPQNGTQYLSLSTLTYIGKISDHDQNISCFAFYIYGRERNMSITVSFNIHSSPTTGGNKSLPEKIFVGTNERLDLTVTLIANPPPEVKWTFSNKTLPGYDISRPDFNLTYVDALRYVTSYKKDKPSQTDFGNYTIEADNYIEPTFLHTFVVGSAQHPSKPFYLDAECYPMTPWINVSWKSNFDGGKPQRFTVFLINSVSNRRIKSHYILDKGQNVIHYHGHKLDYDANYMIYVEAKNVHGEVNSSELVNCTTSSRGSQVEGSSSAVIGGVAGSSAAVIAVAIVALVLVLRHRPGKKGDGKKHLNRFTKTETKQDDEGDEDGLKDNPLYGTSGISTLAEVNLQDDKTQWEMKEPIVKSRNKKQKLKQRMGNEKKGIKLDVYENSENYRKGFNKNIYGNVNTNQQNASSVSFPSSGYKIKKNKDGLIYADLQFAPAEREKKFIVIGSENRTNYAIIDRTQKADPLPDDSDEDVKKDTE